MRRTKRKLSASTLIIIILSVLVVLSSFLGLSGAWFTSKAKADDIISVNFGTVRISVGDVAGGTWTQAKLGNSNKVMPGSEYTGTITLENVGNQAIYFAIRNYRAELHKALNDNIPISNAHIDVYILDGSNRVSTENVGTLGAGLTKSYIVKVVISNLLENIENNYTYCGEQFFATFSLEIGAIQQKNLDSATALTLIQSEDCVPYNVS